MDYSGSSRQVHRERCKKCQFVLFECSQEEHKARQKLKNERGHVQPEDLRHRDTEFTLKDLLGIAKAFVKVVQLMERRSQHDRKFRYDDIEVMMQDAVDLVKTETDLVNDPTHTANMHVSMPGG